MTRADLALLAKKILVGVLLVLVPLGILAGTLHISHKVLVHTVNPK
ncbi:MAG: hypothetical protein ABSG65_29555 [Bryobacteraceae bacterium]|jgi:hypothetical protein